MKLLKRETDVALKALLLIAQNPQKKLDSIVLSRKMNISRQFLRKVLRQLQKSGFLKSARGKRGGFWLEHEAMNLKILQIIETFQGKVELQECLFQKRLCPDIKSCVLRKIILDLEAKLIKVLKNLTLAHLIKMNKKLELKRKLKKE